MRPPHLLLGLALAAVFGAWALSAGDEPNVDPAQTPGWTQDDLHFWLHGSLSDEVIPERVLKAFAGAYPDLFPQGDLRAYGAIGEGLDALPLGFSRRAVDHLGRQVCWGINCAACHSGRVDEAGRPGRVVLSMPGTFDVGGFFGATVVSMLRTTEPKNMFKFLHAYLVVCDPTAGEEGRKDLDAALSLQHDALSKAIRDDPFASKEKPADRLHDIRAGDLEIDGKRLAKEADLLPLVKALLELFHNVRACLHVPEQLPKDSGTAPGPGRADAFAGLANGVLGLPTRPESPCKFGVPWDLEGRTWLDWDGNNKDALSGHVAAALTSGCPMAGDGALVDFKNVKRFRELSEKIRAPRYPFAIDAEAAKRGEKTYTTRCASCHEAPEEKRLYAPADVGTDPNRARLFDQQKVDALNKWLGSLKVEGFDFRAGGLRATGKYLAPAMDGVWARAPYLHNGSVRTMRELLSPPASRAKSWHRGSRVYDPKDLGPADEGAFAFDTSASGNSAGGHDYGTSLPDADKRDLIEYLKTR